MLRKAERWLFDSRVLSTQVRAFAGDGQVEDRVSDARIVVKLVDVNDNAPFFDQQVGFHLATVAHFPCCVFQEELILFRSIT